MTRERFSQTVWLGPFFTVLFFVGCGGGPDDAPTKVEVTGKAKVDGKPLAKEGLIIVFQPAPTEKTGHPTMVDINPEDGTFTGQSTLGKHRVFLEVVGGVEDHGDTSAAAQKFGINPAYISNPSDDDAEGQAKYHEVDVKAEGPNEFEFDFGGT